jgi:hypothetical protein
MRVCDQKGEEQGAGFPPCEYVTREIREEGSRQLGHTVMDEAGDMPTWKGQSCESRESMSEREIDGGN